MTTSRMFFFDPMNSLIVQCWKTLVFNRCHLGYAPAGVEVWPFESCKMCLINHSLSGVPEDFKEFWMLSYSNSSQIRNSSWVGWFLPLHRSNPLPASLSATFLKWNSILSSYRTQYYLVDLWKYYFTFWYYINRLLAHVPQWRSSVHASREFGGYQKMWRPSLAKVPTTGNAPVDKVLSSRLPLYALRNKVKWRKTFTRSCTLCGPFGRTFETAFITTSVTLNMRRFLE